MPEPPGTEAPDPVDPERAQVEAWEIARMVELGVPPDDALYLARAGVSWHHVHELLERGCPPTLAARLI